MTGTPRATRAIDPPVTLKPYAAPARGWKRLIKPVAVLALAFFCLVYGFFYALTTPYLFMLFVTPLAFLMIITIWALPDVRHAPTRTMERFYYAFFVCLILWPNYLAIALPGLPWITLLRLTGIPMALLLLIALSTSKAFRQDLSRVLSVAPPAWKMLLAFVVIQLITIGLSRAPDQSLQKFIVAQTNWTAIFFVSCYVFMRPGSVTRYVTLIWVAALVICGMGIWEAAVQKVLWAGHIPSFLKITDAELLLQSSYRSTSGVYRVKATFSTPLGLAEFLALTMPFLLHFAFGNFRLIVRIAALVSIPIVIRVIDSTDARLGMVGVLISILLYVGVWGMLRWRRLKNDVIGPAVVLAYPAFFVLFVGATFFVRRVEVMVWGDGSQQSSTDARTTQWTMGLPKVFANPIGYGAGQGSPTLGFYVGGFQTIDTYYLAIMLEYGIIGFFLYYALILYVGWLGAGRIVNQKGFSEPEAQFIVPASISLGVFFVIKSVFAQQDNHPLIYMLMGMIIALLYRMNRRADIEAKSAAAQAR